MAKSNPMSNSLAYKLIYIISFISYVGLKNFHHFNINVLARTLRFIFLFTIYYISNKWFYIPPLAKELSKLRPSKGLVRGVLTRAPRAVH